MANLTFNGTIDFIDVFAFRNVSLIVIQDLYIFQIIITAIMINSNQ